MDNSGVWISLRKEIHNLEIHRISDVSKLNSNNQPSHPLLTHHWNCSGQQKMFRLYAQDSVKLLKYMDSPLAGI